jgi:two-component system sensor histidine kinase HydH
MLYLYFSGENLLSLTKETILSRRNQNKFPNFLNIIRLSLAFILILSSGAIIYSTARNIQSAQLLADQSLENTALALSSAAEIALRREGKGTDSDIREIFSDRVVAYALIANQKGEILFHTNPRLAGTVLSAEEKGSLGMSKKASGRRIILGTGLPAYEFNYPLYMVDGATEWLRLILHTTSTDSIITDARRTWWIGSLVLLLLWIVGILFERVWTSSIKLKVELDRKKQLAIIGQMTALLAHEIRNALASIKGYAQWVDEKLDSADTKKLALASVLQGTTRIEILVQELLQFSRDESFKFERIAVVPLLKDAIESVVSGWNGTWNLEEIPLAFVNADEEKLRRVFINGVQNAVQVMGNNGFLLVSVHHTGRWIQVKIEDSGPGISDAQKSLLFTPFHTTKTDGTGLGLAYSRKVMEGMKGKIDLDNKKNGQGAMLTIYIPKAGE